MGQLYHILSSQGSGITEEEKARVPVPEAVHDTSVLWTQQGGCPYKLMAFVTAGTRPVQTKSELITNPNMEKGDAYEFQAKERLIIDSSCDRANHA